MGVRVLDGERPGYAILVFDEPIAGSTLRLAIRSLQVHQGAYVGPSGSFGKLPYYFDTQRVTTDDGVEGFRVGPEIVNHLLEYDQIEARSEDGALCAQGVWENATPSMRTQGAAHIGIPTTTLSAAAPERPPVTPPASDEPAASPQPPRPTSGGESQRKSVAPAPTPSRRLPLLIGLAALGLLALVAALVPAVRCGLFKIDCVEVPHRDDATQRLVDARACAAANPCVADACFQKYLGEADEAGKSAARAEIVRAKEACAPPPPRPPVPAQSPEQAPSDVPDGQYNARARAGCGAKAQTVIIAVKAGHVSWTHRAPIAENAAPIDIPWRGTIDSRGAIAASFNNSSGYSATGRYADTEREVAMRYPGCAAPVVMTIMGRSQ